MRSKAKPQSSWLLHLAGDHHQSFETKPLLHGQHMMRCMLTANLAVDRACLHVDSSTAVLRQACGRTIKQKQDQRFANGTQGRLLHWSPSDAAVEGSKRAVPASHPGLFCSCAAFHTQFEKERPLCSLRKGDCFAQSRRSPARYRHGTRKCHQLGASCILMMCTGCV